MLEKGKRSVRDTCHKYGFVYDDFWIWQRGMAWGSHSEKKMIIDKD